MQIHINICKYIHIYMYIYICIYIKAEYTVRVSKHHHGQSFGDAGRARDFLFWGDLMTFFNIICVFNKNHTKYTNTHSFTS